MSNLTRSPKYIVTNDSSYTHWGTMEGAIGHLVTMILVSFKAGQDISRWHIVVGGVTK